MRFVDTADVRAWYRESHDLDDVGGMGDVLAVPFHLQLLARELRRRGELGPGALDSIPFYSLCRGLFIPLEAMVPEKAAQLFGLQIEPPPRGEEREALLRRFVEADVGLTDRQKVRCLLGDPFEGKPSRFRRESLLRLLTSMTLVTRRQLLDRLAVVGDASVLFAESRPELRADPPLTAAEVLETLRILPDQKRNAQFELLRSVLRRCGKVEAYFLVRLVLGKAGLRYESELLARLLGERYGVEAEQITHAMALVDTFEVVRILDREGPEGLKKVELQPLVPVRPALASGQADAVKRFPVWVERKYDGIRLMLHKASDAMGSVLCGAYSRNRRDYLELLSGLDATIKMLPVRSAIVDGELHGTILDRGGPRPAQVYEVFGALQGEATRPVQLRYAAFDLLYLDGQDLTQEPLSERRRRLQALVAPLAAMPVPIPVGLAEGQLASSMEDVKRLYQHFRHQGYEGILTKDLQGVYRLASRDPSWLKRKPAETLDLVLLGAVLAVTTKERAGMFGSYVIGARTADGTFEDVGDVAGVDVERDAQIQQTIMSEGLLTGQRIERAGASGTRPGFELVPHLVVTVRFDGVVRDSATGRLSLRDPKLVVIRSDKAPYEADTVQAIDAHYLRQSMG